MIFTEPNAPSTRTRPDTAARTAVVFGIAGILLILLIAFSQVILSINPYKEAAEQVNYLLQSAPDLETRLDYSNLTLNRLKNQIDPELASSITTQLEPSAEEKLIAALALEGIRSTDVRTFTGLLDGVAQETLALHAALLKENQAASLKPVLYKIRQEPDSIDTTRLNEIYEVSPIVIENLNELRRRMQSLSNNMRLISDSAQLTSINEVLDGKDPEDFPNLGSAEAYLKSYTAWKSLPSACESLEIQFAGTVTILDNIFTAVNAARLKDRRMGYSMWEPTARWVDSHLILTIATAVVFLITAAIAFYQRKPSTDQSDPTGGKIESRLGRIVASAMSPTRPRALERETESAAAAAPLEKTPQVVLHRRTTRGWGGSNTRFVVLRSSGGRETKHLSTEKAFRIGSDPRNPVHIENSDKGYIEIWVRFAHAGFFIEVMYSESPVMINRQPFTGARALHNGDLIQVLDVSLIFFEG
ncbi:MAG: FHA domain-containing protein [Bellilinea sp.]